MHFGKYIRRFALVFAVLNDGIKGVGSDAIFANFVLKLFEQSFHFLFEIAYSLHDVLLN